MNNNFRRYLELSILILVSFSPLISQELKAVITLLLVIINAKHLNVKIFNRKKSILLIFMCFFLLNLVYDLRNVNSILEISILSFYFPLCVLAGFVFSQKYKLNEFLIYSEKIIYLFAIFSLIGVIIYNFFPNIIYSMPTYRWAGHTHRTIGLFNIMTPANYLYKRNAGIAWEPGAFQLLLNLGIYANIKYSNRINIMKIVIYSVAVFTTKSTAGLMILMIIIAKVVTKDKRVAAVFFISALIFGTQILSQISYQYNYKLFGSSAFNDRLQPLLNAFRIGNKFILGVGNTGFDKFYRTQYNPPWDSLGQVFIRYGYLMFGLILFRLFKLLKNHMLLFAILLITFTSQNIWYIPLVTPFYFFSTREESKFNLNKND